MTEIKLKNPVRESDHHRGPLHAPIVLVEYGDFECPYCYLAAATLDQIVKDFSPGVSLVFRHFPLAQIHPHSELASLAAEAAGVQGKFWEMYHLLFANQQSLSSEMILGLADTLDLNVEQFRCDLRRNDLFEKIQSDFMGGTRSGVNGTPTLFLNGYKLKGPVEYGFLRRTIESFKLSEAVR